MADKLEKELKKIEENAKVLGEIKEGESELVDSYAELQREFVELRKRIHQLLQKPIFGRILLYAILSESDRSFLTQVAEKDLEVNRELIGAVRELVEKLEKASENLERITDAYKLLSNGINSLGDEIEQASEKIQESANLLSREVLRFENSLKVQIKKGGRKVEMSLPELLRLLIMELGGAVEERRRLTDTIYSLEDTKKMLSQISPLVYNDIPQLVEENRKLRYLNIALVGMVALSIVLNLIVLIKSL